MTFVESKNSTNPPSEVRGWPVKEGNFVRLRYNGGQVALGQALSPQPRITVQKMGVAEERASMNDENKILY
jgi:hypothetical protein